MKWLPLFAVLSIVAGFVAAWEEHWGFWKQAACTVTLFMLFAILLLLAGCVAMTDPIALRHADGRIVKCGPYQAYEWGGGPSTASAIREGQCISDFQRQGFERVATE